MAVQIGLVFHWYASSLLMVYGGFVIGEIRSVSSANLARESHRACLKTANIRLGAFYFQTQSYVLISIKNHVFAAQIIRRH